jgi:hypothetical protein
VLYFEREKAKCILFNIYSDFLCWLAAAAALSGNMDNSNQTPT